MKLTVWLVLATLAPANAKVPDHPILAYSTPEGVVWVDSANRVELIPDGEESRTVWEGNLAMGAVAGRRLVIGAQEKLLVFEPGSWTPKEKVVEDWIWAMAGSPDLAVAFDKAGGVWRLEKNGIWKKQDSGIKDDVQALSYYRGLWVAVGATPSKELDSDDAGPASYGQPNWVLEQNEPRTWWSTDGIVWQPGILPITGFNRLLAVAGGPAGWVAAGVDGGIFISKDGKTWTEADVTDRRYQEEGIDLMALGGFFWMRVGTHDWSRSTDGNAWESVPTFAGARCDMLFMKDGKVQAIGLRKAGRDLEVAAVEAFGEAPPLNAVELAAKAAAEEQARIAAEEKAAQERKAVEVRALAEKKAAEAKVRAEKQAAEAKALAEQRAREERLKPVIAALELFDREVGAASNFGQMGKPMARLVKALDESGQTRLADAVAAVSTEYLPKLGGARGVFDYVMAAPDKRFGPMMKPLTQPQRVAIKAMASTVNDKSPEAVTAARSAESGWPPSARAANTKGPISAEWPLVDIPKLRKAVARGNMAATFDLGAAHNSAVGVPQDAVLAAFWRRVFEKLHPDMPDFARDTKAVYAYMTRAGSPNFCSKSAQTTLEANGYRFTDELLGMLEQAFADGDNYAGIMLQDNEETLALRKEGLTFEQIYAAYPDREQRHADIITKSKAVGLNSRQIIITLDKDTAYMAAALSADTSKPSDTPIGQAMAMETANIAAKSSPVAAEPPTADTLTTAEKAEVNRQKIKDSYIAGQGRKAEIHRQLADIAFKAATRTVPAEEAASDEIRKKELQATLRRMRDNTVMSFKIFASTHEGKMREGLAQQAVLLAMAMEPFQELAKLRTTYVAGTRDPAMANIAPYAQILFGRQLVDYAASLPATGRREKLRAWLGAHPMPKGRSNEFEAYYGSGISSQFTLFGDSYSGLELADAWLPWFGYKSDLHVDRAEYLARQGRRDEALRAFDLAHVLRPEVTEPFEFEKLLMDTEPILWSVPEEPYLTMQILMMRVSTLDAAKEPLSVMEANAAIRTLGRRLDLASRLPAGRREAALTQVLTVLNPNQADYVPDDLPAKVNPVVERFKAARTPEAYREVIEALPLEAAGTVQYWQIRATCASYVEPEATERFIAVVAALKPKSDWLKVPVDLLRERAKIIQRQALEGPSIEPQIAAWLKEGEQAFLAGNLPGMKTTVDKILAKEPKSAPGRMLLARYTAGSGQTATADQLLQEIAGDKSLWSGYQAQAWGLRAGLVLEQAGKAIPQLAPAEQASRLAEATKTINDYANQALALNANQPEAHLTLAMLAAAGGQTAMQNAVVRADIRKHLDAALTAQPGHVQALMMRFQLNGMEANLEGAIADATAILKAAPEIHQVRVMLIQLLAQARRWDEAQREVDELQRRKVPQADQIRDQLQQMRQSSTSGSSRGGKK